MPLDAFPGIGVTVMFDSHGCSGAAHAEGMNYLNEKSDGVQLLGMKYYYQCISFDIIQVA
ncbi:hypothetical protein LP419_13070 [Massilia sp. H-1]|nr:hypothetical protein LP419_13070 [Massilia sp. H-1]